MKLYKLVGFSALILAIFQQCQPAPPKDLAQNTKGDDVESIYVTSCAGCHGSQLQRFKMLKTYDKPLADIVDVVKNGNTEKGMPDFQALGD
ncbi:MAG: cytochrome c, partial [Bacteroidota bacterium]